MFYIKYILLSGILVLPLPYGYVADDSQPTIHRVDTQHEHSAYGELPDHTFLPNSLTRKWRECSTSCADALDCTKIKDMKGMQCHDIETEDQWTLGAKDIRWLRIHCQNMCYINKQVHCYDDCIESMECTKVDDEEAMQCTDPGYKKKWTMQKKEFGQLVSHCISRCDPRPHFKKDEESKIKKCQARCKENERADKEVSKSLDECLNQCVISTEEDKKLLWSNCRRECKESMLCDSKSDPFNKKLISCNTSLSDYHWMFKTDYKVEDFCKSKCHLDSLAKKRTQDEEMGHCYNGCTAKFFCEQEASFFISCDNKNYGWNIDKSYVGQIICNDECGYQPF